MYDTISFCNRTFPVRIINFDNDYKVIAPFSLATAVKNEKCNGRVSDAQAIYNSVQFYVPDDFFHTFSDDALCAICK